MLKLLNIRYFNTHFYFREHQVNSIYGICIKKKYKHENEYTRYTNY